MSSLLLLLVRFIDWGFFFLKKNIFGELGRAEMRSLNG